jgi:hypothetical protein
MSPYYKNKNSKNVSERAKEKKKELMKYKGSVCFFCGYNKYDGALEFHHINPGEKEFNINLGTLSKSWERCFAEVNKCILICANCHRELHAGLIKYDVSSDVVPT